MERCRRAGKRTSCAASGGRRRTFDSTTLTGIRTETISLFVEWRIAMRSTRKPVAAAAPKAAEIVPITKMADEELAAMCKALGHPVRIQIVRMLARHGQCYFGSIADAVS